MSDPIRIARVHITGTTPYSPGKKPDTDKKPKETYEDYEARVWKERIHFDKEGKVYIPDMSRVRCVQAAAKYANIKYKNQETYTKFFDKGVQANGDRLYIGMSVDDAYTEKHLVPTNGKPGGSSKAFKVFPYFHANPEKPTESWGGVMGFMVLEPRIPEAIFEQVVDTAGKFIGIGRFRPENRGNLGMFRVVKVEWSELR